MMNKEKKSGWYYDDTIKIAVGFLLLSVCYIIAVSVFISKGDDKLVGAFEAITGLSGLVLSFGTVFYVIKTYSTQKEQVRIQKDLIDSQRQEIEENKKDVEFNRALDLVYRQLEHTNTKVTYIKNPNNKVLSNLYNKKLLFQNYIQVKTFLNDYHNEIMLYVNIIDRDILTQQQKIQLGQIFILNTSYDLSAIYNDIYNIISSEKDLQIHFNSFIINQYERNKLLDYYDMSREEMKIQIIKDYQKDINKDIDTFINLCEINYTIKSNLEYLAGKIL